MHYRWFAFALFASGPLLAWPHAGDVPPSPDPRPPAIPRAELADSERWEAMRQSPSGHYSALDARGMLDALDRIDAEPGDWRDRAEKFYADLLASDVYNGRVSASRLVDYLRSNGREPLADRLQSVFDRKADAHAAGILEALVSDRSIANATTAEDPELVKAFSDLLSQRVPPRNARAETLVQGIFASTTPDGLRWLFDESFRIPALSHPNMKVIAQNAFNANRSSIPRAYADELRDLELDVHTQRLSPEGASDLLQRLVARMQGSEPALRHGDSQQLLRALGFLPWGDFLSRSPAFSFGRAPTPTAPVVAPPPPVPPTARSRSGGPDGAPAVEGPAPETVPVSPPSSFVSMPAYQPPPLTAPSGNIATRAPQMRWRFPILRRLFRRR